MKTILFVETGSGFGGSAVCLANLTRWLNRTSYRPLVAYYSEGLGIKRIQQQGIPTVPLHRGRSWLELVRLIRRERVDLVHGNNDLYSHLASVLAARWMRRPYLMHMRGIRPLTRLERWLMRQVTYFIVISDAGRRFYLQQGMPQERSSTIHDAIDLTLFNGHVDAQAARRALDIGRDEVVLGIVSRLVPKKGHRDLLRAVALLSRELPQVRLRCVIVGGDPNPQQAYEAELRQLAYQLGIADRLLFTGWRDDVPQLTASFDIAIQASEYIEGFGTAVLEAMALRKPVVATAVGGVPELVEQEETGLLVPPTSPERLTEALRRLIEDPALRARFGETGRQRVEAYFDLSQQVKHIEGLYARILSGGRT